MHKVNEELLANVKKSAYKAKKSSVGFAALAAVGAESGERFEPMAVGEADKFREVLKCVAANKISSSMLRNIADAHKELCAEEFSLFLPYLQSRLGDKEREGFDKMCGAIRKMRCAAGITGDAADEASDVAGEASDAADIAGVPASVGQEGFDIDGLARTPFPWREIVTWRKQKF
jgi:hypothetical protein